MAESEKPVVPVEVLSSGPPPRRISRGVVLGVAAAALALVGGWAVVRQPWNAGASTASNPSASNPSLSPSAPSVTPSAVATAALATGSPAPRVCAGRDPGSSPLCPPLDCLRPTAGFAGGTGRGPALLLGGRQLLRVDLRSGDVHALTACGGPGVVRWPLESVAGAWVTSDSRPGSELHLPGDATHPAVDRRYPTSLIEPGLPGHVLVAMEDGPGLLTRYRVLLLDDHGRTLARMHTRPALLVLGETAAGLVVMTGDDAGAYAVLRWRDGRAVRRFGTGRFGLGFHRGVVAWLPIGGAAAPTAAADGVTPYRCDGGCPDVRLTDTRTGATDTIAAMPGGRVPLDAVLSSDGRRVLMSFADHGGGVPDGAVVMVDRSSHTTRALRALHDVSATAGGVSGPETVWGADGAVYVAERTGAVVRVLRWSPDTGTTSTVVTLHGDPFAVRLVAG